MTATDTPKAADQQQNNDDAKELYAEVNAELETLFEYDSLPWQQHKKRIARRDIDRVFSLAAKRIQTLLERDARLRSDSYYLRYALISAHQLQLSRDYLRAALIEGIKAKKQPTGGSFIDALN
jgi:hypothetical protein